MHRALDSQLRPSRLHRVGRGIWTLVAASVALLVVAGASWAVARNGGSADNTPIDGAAAVQTGSSASFGTMPQTGDPADDYAAAPDFISVLSRDGSSIAGYIKKSDMATAGQGRLILHTGTVDVYARDGVTVVGQLHPGKGFVSISEDPGAVPSQSKTVEHPSADTPSG